MFRSVFRETATISTFYKSIQFESEAVPPYSKSESPVQPYKDQEKPQWSSDLHCQERDLDLMKPHMLEAVEEELGEKELQWQAFRCGMQLAAV